MLNICIVVVTLDDDNHKSLTQRITIWHQNILCYVMLYYIILYYIILYYIILYYIILYYIILYYIYYIILYYILLCYVIIDFHCLTCPHGDHKDFTFTLTFPALWELCTMYIMPQFDYTLCGFRLVVNKIL